MSHDGAFWRTFQRYGWTDTGYYDDAPAFFGAEMSNRQWRDDTPDRLDASLDRAGVDAETRALLDAFIKGGGPQPRSNRGRRKRSVGVKRKDIRNPSPLPRAAFRDRPVGSVSQDEVVARGEATRLRNTIKRLARQAERKPEQREALASEIEQLRSRLAEMGFPE